MEQSLWKTGPVKKIRKFKNFSNFYFGNFRKKIENFNREKLCLAGLEIRKIGLLQPIQVLEETEQSKYQFGCLGCMSERIKELPPRLEYEGNGTYYTIITVKLAQEHSHISPVSVRIHRRPHHGMSMKFFVVTKIKIRLKKYKLRSI